MPWSQHYAAWEYWTPFCSCQGIIGTLVVDIRCESRNALLRCQIGKRTIHTRNEMNWFVFVLSCMKAIGAECGLTRVWDASNLGFGKDVISIYPPCELNQILLEDRHIRCFGVEFRLCMHFLDVPRKQRSWVLSNGLVGTLSYDVAAPP